MAFLTTVFKKIIMQILRINSACPYVSLIVYCFVIVAALLQLVSIDRLTGQISVYKTPKFRETNSLA